MLIDPFEDRGQANEQGQTEIAFGILFDETGNIFDALSGICKTAKKYKVVSIQILMYITYTQNFSTGSDV